MFLALSLGENSQLEHVKIVVERLDVSYKFSVSYIYIYIKRKNERSTIIKFGYKDIINIKNQMEPK